MEFRFPGAWDWDGRVWAPRLVFLMGPWAAFWMVELLNGNDVFADLLFWQAGMNLIWYYLAFFALWLILGRPRGAAAAGAALFFGVGLLNHFVLRFRGRILFPADVVGWRTALNVADAFDFSPDWRMVQGAALLTAYLFLVWSCPPARERAALPRWAAALLLAGAVAYSWAFFCTGMLPALGVYTQQWVTQANGFLLNFTVAMRYSSVDRPRGYSRQAALELLEAYSGGGKEAVSPRPVNLVVVMNESFADFSRFEGLEPSEDPTPFLHSLEEDTVRGWMYAPVTGGGTASVEFEFLTGFSTCFQPPHTVAYQLYVEAGMPSLAALAAGEGYGTTAFHPYKASGWNRPVAYSHLGFQAQRYEEDVEEPFLIRRYISDLSAYEEIFRITEESQSPAFVFAVTMQNHSGYAQGWNNLPRSISLPEELRRADRDAEQFFALLRESDRALEALIQSYSQTEEPTLVVFFGDHQPPLTTAFYEALYGGKPLAQRTTQEVLEQYAVPFFLWANYDIEEAEDVFLSPNFLGVLTARTAGLPMTAYMRFLEALSAHLPVITPVGYIDGAGVVRREEELTQEQRQWLEWYELLNYCGVEDLFPEVRSYYCAPES